MELHIITRCYTNLSVLDYFSPQYVRITTRTRPVIEHMHHQAPQGALPPRLVPPGAAGGDDDMGSGVGVGVGVEIDNNVVVASSGGGGGGRRLGRDAARLEQVGLELVDGVEGVAVRGAVAVGDERAGPLGGGGRVGAAPPAPPCSSSSPYAATVVLVVVVVTAAAASAAAAGLLLDLQHQHRGGEHPVADDADVVRAEELRARDVDGDGPRGAGEVVEAVGVDAAEALHDGADGVAGGYCLCGCWG